jgi:hypothetical protein
MLQGLLDRGALPMPADDDGAEALAGGSWTQGLGLAFRLLHLGGADAPDLLVDLPGSRGSGVSLAAASGIGEAVQRLRCALDALGTHRLDPGRIYEELAVLRPGIAIRSMVRLRRGALESVVPAKRGMAWRGRDGPSGGRVGIRFVEELPSGAVHTHVALSRKRSGSFYTPPAIVRFLVEHTLAPLVTAGRGLAELRLLDPAMGAGHLLVPAARFVAERLAVPVREVAERCVFGVDLDPLAVELVRLSLWSASGESGLPGTFGADHLRVGDALTGARPTEGFDAVLANPPWEALRPRAREFFADLDLRVLDAPTRRERQALESALLEDPRIRRQHEAYEQALADQRRQHTRGFHWQVAEVEGRRTGGDPDLWKLFLECCTTALGPRGRLGIVVPSAFHTNASATGVRRLMLGKTAIEACYSFENRQGLFDIHRSFKFDVLVARRDDAGTERFPCAFYLRDPAWLDAPRPQLRYSRSFLARVGGPHRVFPELRSREDLAVVEACYAHPGRFGALCDRLGVHLRSGLHMTSDSHRLTPARGDGDPRDPQRARRLRTEGWLLLHEGKTFHQFDDRWGDPPRYLVHEDRVADRPAWLRAAGYPRLAYRAVASSTNERTGIFAVLPAGALCGNSAPAEAEPWARPASAALAVCALANTCVVDYLLRVRSSANLNQFILREAAVPDLVAIEPLLVHTALRLSCNHAGFAGLWREQVGDAWAEGVTGPRWPVIPLPARRVVLLARLDAAVAHAFGLRRELLAHLLGCFSHRSQPALPGRCLEAYDELMRGDASAVLRGWDPYAAVGIVRELPA